MANQAGSIKYMRPVVIKLGDSFHRKECRMCGRDISKIQNYSYISPVSETKLTICRVCSVREYYGTGGKMSLRYKTDVANNKLFGVEGND